MVSSNSFLRKEVEIEEEREVEVEVGIVQQELLKFIK